MKRITQTPPEPDRLVLNVRGPQVLFAVYRFRLGEPAFFFTWSGCLN
jgi:hypothetical protein